MRFWKRELKKELKSVVPKMNDELQNAPILSAEGTPRVKAEEKKPAPVFTRRLAFAISCLAVILAVSLTLVFTITANKSAANVTAFSLEVNPSAMFTVKNGKVSSVTATNADADVILASDERLAEMVGVSPEASVRIFLDYAAKLGYVDLDEQGIVRLTVLDGGLAVTDAVEEYFKGKGCYFAVWESVVGIDEFCEKNGVSLQKSVKNLVSAASEMPRLFCEREILGKSIDEVQKLYGERIEAGDYKDYYESVLKHYLTEITERAIAIENVSDIYDKIYNNDESIFKDYWSIKGLVDIVDYSEELTALLGEMDAALEVCRVKYGQDIKNAVDLALLKEIYSWEKVEHVKDLVEDFYGYFSAESLMVIEDVFREIGVELSYLTKLPENKGEYLEQISEIISLEFDCRVERTMADYSASRQAIDNDGYEGFIKGVADEYGSLENYWNKKNN